MIPKWRKKGLKREGSGGDEAKARIED